MIGLAELQGHWRRAWIKASGLNDTTTRVHWLQCGAFFADLRLPTPLPVMTGAHALADLPPRCLLALMKAEGFAGSITVEDNTCTWAREINWHGTPDVIDAGHLSFAEDGALLEDGVHAAYRERWIRQPATVDEVWHVSDAGQEIYLLSSRTTFLLAMGRPGAAASAPLIEALEQGKLPAGLDSHFDQLYALGPWRDGDGIVHLSTNPLLTGHPLITRDPMLEGGFTLSYQRFDGTWVERRLEMTTPAQFQTQPATL